MSTASPIQAHEFTTKVCQLLWDTAELAGTEAATKAVPTPNAAHAYAMADSLQQYGIHAYADGRLD